MYKERLVYLREKKEIKQYELADILNIYKGTYNQYETEYIIIPLKHLITIADYFNVSLDYIFNFTKEEQYSHNNVSYKDYGKRLKEFRKENN